MGHSNRSGRVYVYGNPSGNHLIIMSAGFPDNQTAFTAMAQRLASDIDNNDSNNCLVAITCLPGYDDSMDWSDYPPDGFTFEDWVGNMQEAVKALRKCSTQPVSHTTLTGVFHDWGVVMGTMYMNSMADATDSSSLGLTIDRLVIYDVLMPPHPHSHLAPKGLQNKSLWDNCCLITYQLVLAGAFLMNRYIPFAYVTLLYYLVTNSVLSLCGMYPISKEDRLYIEEHWKSNSLHDLQKTWYKAYPYFQFWKHIFQGKIHYLAFRLALPKDLSKVPVLYLYGSSKPYDLADANAFQLLTREQAEGGLSRVVRVDSAGHWLYVQQQDLCYDAMKQFFAVTIPDTTASEGMLHCSTNNNKSYSCSTNSDHDGSDVKDQDVTTKLTAGPSGSCPLRLPKSQCTPSNGSSDSTSTGKTTNMSHEISHNDHEEIANTKLCGIGSSVSGTLCHIIENDNGIECICDNGNRSMIDSATQAQQTKRRKSVNVAEPVEASFRSTPSQEDELWKSNAAMKLYAVVVLSAAFRSLFILQGISLLIIFHLMKLLFSWFVFVKDAKEIGELKGLAWWWINIGLRFSTKTMEGDTIHTIVTAFTLNFWAGTGINILTYIYHYIDQDRREKFLRHARENLNRAHITHMKWKNLRLNQQRSKSSRLSQ
jgi:pimeloyl-ACP methyl ester carboxylesterase